MPQPLLPLLAHQSAVGNQWLGILTVAALVVVVVFVLALLGRVPLASAGDLLLPAAVVVLLAGLGGSLGDAVADRAPWGVPVLAVLAVALVVAATTGVELRPTSPLGYGAVALAVLAAVLAGPRLQTLWFPPEDTLPIPEDARVALTLLDGPDADGTVRVALEVTGGSLGPGPTTTAPDDIETGMLPRFTAGQTFLTPLPDAGDCIAGCSGYEYELTLPADDEGALPERLRVDMFTATEAPFAPPVAATVDLPAP